MGVGSDMVMVMGGAGGGGDDGVCNRYTYFNVGNIKFPPPQGRLRMLSAAKISRSLNVMHDPTISLIQSKL